MAKSRKTRNLKVSYRTETRHPSNRYGSEYIWVPSINLKGKWLEELGFGIDTPIKVACENGRLVITKEGV